MKISLITPAKKRSKSGNRTTALRWAHILRDLGHRVEIAVEYEGQNADLMIALHAWRSASPIKLFRDIYPNHPLVLALTGTDINEFIRTDPKPTLASMETADALVCLHDLTIDVTPKKFRQKLHVIYQSAPPLPKKRRPAKMHFDICLIGHMRDVKDPLRGALALRDVSESSKLRLIHMGKAHNNAWEKRGLAEMKRNPRYLWQREKAGWQVRRELGKTNLMIITSLSEGGANVVSEALVAGVPVIASEINGNVGMLGKDYPGYYPVGNEKALQKLLLKCENDKMFLADLTKRCKARAKLFKPAEEKRRWKKLLAELKT